MLADLPAQIILDVFGTVAFIGDKQRPFSALLACAPAFARDREAARAMGARFLTEPISLERAFGLCGLPEADPLRAQLSERHEREIASIRLHEDAVSFVKMALSRGHGVALCSNLAQPYQAPVQALLASAGVPDLPFFSSFDIGFAKPEPAIYRFALDALGRQPKECFFAGDTPAADRDGPRAAGMQSTLIERRRGLDGPKDPESAQDFAELASRWGWPAFAREPEPSPGLRSSPRSF